jgi:hypothetical protein
VVKEAKAVIPSSNGSRDVFVNKRRIHQKAFCEESYAAIVIREADEADATVFPRSAHLGEIQEAESFCLAAS